MPKSGGDFTQQHYIAETWGYGEWGCHCEAGKVVILGGRKWEEVWYWWGVLVLQNCVPLRVLHLVLFLGLEDTETGCQDDAAHHLIPGERPTLRVLNLILVLIILSLSARAAEAEWFVWKSAEPLDSTGLTAWKPSPMVVSPEGSKQAFGYFG